MDYIEKNIEALEKILNDMVAKHGGKVMETEDYKYLDEQLERYLKLRGY